MNIAIVGVGYVGLTTGACLADMGNNVICVDKDEEKINLLKKGKITIYEPTLEELVQNNLNENRLSFNLNLEEALNKSEVCFICVGTPQNQDGSVDLSQVFEVTKEIAQKMKGYKLIVNKSTVPPKTLEKLENLIKENTKEPFDICSNPEFLKQGSAVRDFLYPDRIIIGTNSQKAIKTMKEIYSSFLRTSGKLIVMDSNSAEMTKYCANSFLAMKISFMNEIANLCEKTGADIEKVRMGISLDNRIGNKFLFSGIGYGGSCFPKDTKALIKIGAQNDCEMNILKAVDKTNELQKTFFVDKILKYFNNDLKNKTFAVWGLAFKPKTNDMREAPSIKIINSLLDKGAKIIAYDPKAQETAKKIFKDKITYSKTSYDALLGADGLLLLTEWNEFRLPDFKKIKNALKIPVIFDGRNQYDKESLKEYGLEYFCIGK